MSVQASKYAREQCAARRSLTDGQRLVLLAIATYSNPGNREAWPSADTLAKIVGRHPSSVRRILYELVALELVESRPRPGLETVYVFPLEQPLEMVDDYPQPRASERAGSEMHPARLSARPPRASERAHPRASERAGSYEKKESKKKTAPQFCTYCLTQLDLTADLEHGIHHGCALALARDRDIG
jgi:DNA-binding MarR family transcriptional regulator